MSALEAILAGRKPPRTPITEAKAIPQRNDSRSDLKIKARLAEGHIVPDTCFNTIQRQHEQEPQQPPSKESNNDSTTNETRMLTLENPRTRRVPISFDRRATAAYMVFIAAKQLPIAMMTATNTPRN
jgi:hypothetical protein